MEMLVRSAKAFALAIKIEHFRYTPKCTDPDKEGSKKKAFDKIKEEEGFLAQQMVDIPRGDSRVYAKAHVIALNALGRACFLMAEYDDALKHFKKALREHMPKDSVDVYVNLAAVFWKQKEVRAPDWWVKAEELLKRALEINPTNRKANHYLGRVYSSNEVKNFEKAKDHFAKAGADPWSTYCLAEILIGQDQNYIEGIRLLRQSISLDPTPDDRFEFFLKTIITLIKEKPLPKELREKDLLSDAKNMARKLIDLQESKKLKARANFYLAQILIDKEGNFLKGIELLKKSIKLYPEAGDRYVYFLESIPPLIQKKELPEDLSEKDLLGYAKDLAEKLQKEGSTAELKNKGTEYLKIS
jgi:tetratricopeptide (TPR) repeat protein